MSNHETISVPEAALPLIGTVVLLVLSIAVWRSPIYPALAGGLVLAALVAHRRGAAPGTLVRAALAGARHTYPVVSILALIGILIATWMSSGTVPGLIYYGLKLVTPQFLAVAAFVLTMATSLVLGTSIGTLSTVGVAVMGIAQSLSAPLPLIAGALVSGAFVGDRSSPLSSAFHLNTTMTESQADRNLRWMSVTALPAIAACLALYTWLGLSLSSASSDQVVRIMDSMSNRFNLGPLVILPPLAVIVLAVRRIPIKLNLGLGIALGLGLALFLQQRPLPEVLRIVWYGYREAAVGDVLLTLKGGGLGPMINLLLLVLTAGAFNGVMEQTGLMRRLIEALLGRVRSTVHLIISTALISVGMAAVACNQALAIIVPARMLRPIYVEKGLPPELLARTLADSGLVVAGLIPWNMLAVLVSASVGVPVFEFAPYAFFLWMLPILTLGLGYWTYRRPTTTAESRDS